MKRRRKRRASPAPLICLLAVLACIVALRISVSEETAASAQMTGKLENPATTAPVRLLEAEMTEAEQVTRAEDRPARAAFGRHDDVPPLCGDDAETLGRQRYALVEIRHDPQPKSQPRMLTTTQA